MIRILGIDPGSRLTGYGVVELHGNRAVCVTNGCLRVGEGEVAERLKQIHLGLVQLIEEFQPQEAAIESVFVQRNVDSALKLGQARGTAITAIALNDVPVFEYAPAVIKKSVVGRGNASKPQVQHMVRAILGVQSTLQSDAADALAVALCHGHARNAPVQIAMTRRRHTRWR
ncbi:MAG: crossover junction endodeoxyribonuclease RuvC [Gammaproteobacteria bacterium]|nr:crossover junction endodeoxyribonuclease RuvC [Gammaproteobacteria bacterium]